MDLIQIQIMYLLVKLSIQLLVETVTNVPVWKVVVYTLSE